MKNYFLNLITLLSIVVASFAITTNASASTLHNYASDRCLAVGGGTLTNQQKSGTGLIIWDCATTTDPSQQWGLNSMGAPFPAPPSNGSALGLYLLSSVTSNRYITTKLTSSGLGTYPYVTNGAPVFSSISTGAATQQWWMHWQGKDFRGHDCYIIESNADQSSSTGVGATEVVGVSGGSKSNGAQVVMWQQFFDKNGYPDFINHPDQYWCVYN